MASTSTVKYLIPCELNEHNYSKSSKQKNTKQDKDLKTKQTNTTVKDIVKIPTKQPVVEQSETLFGLLKVNKNLIILPDNWFCEVSKNSIQIPIAVTFFTLNNSCFCKKRYIEKQLVIDKDSELTFIINGKNLTPLNFNVKDYVKPTDILSLQNFIEKFDSIKICQGVTKLDLLKNVNLRIFESNDRWWNPECTNIPDKKSFLCQFCKLLNSVLLKVLGQRRNHQQKPLPIDNNIPKIKRSNVIKLNSNQIKMNTPAKKRKMSKITSTHKPGSHNASTMA